MAYCPEDGALMKTVCLHYNACYDCPTCGTHWSYIDGSYEGGTSSECPVHNYCSKCQEKQE